MGNYRYAYEDEIRIQTPGDGECLLLSDSAGSSVTALVSGEVVLDAEDRRWLIRWLAARTPGFHVIECEHAEPPKRAEP